MRIKLSGPAKCKICGKDDFVYIDEVTDHMIKHSEFNGGLNVVLPGFKDKIDKLKKET